MNGIVEPLPGLLDDPQFQISDLPLTDFHIAPLRNPAPSKHSNAPSPLEPVTGNQARNSSSDRQPVQAESSSKTRSTPKITPNDVLLARESKKPHLAISELLEGSDGTENIPHQLPSFVSLSVVEKSPIQPTLTLSPEHMQKKPRLDPDPENLSFDVGRQLPRPAQKEQNQHRAPPLLPAMVTGLHEPPPSAGLLPSMDPDNPAQAKRGKSSKIHVKDIISSLDSKSPSPTHRTMSQIQTQEANVTFDMDLTLQTAANSGSQMEEALRSPDANVVKESKARRVRRKWTEKETTDLLAGVKKHGIGKWKQILDDPAYRFDDRNSVDLKDRYRVCSKDETYMLQASTPNSATATTSPNPSDANQLGQLKQRRKRRAWTSAEDEALLSGVAQYGFQWTLIHEDPKLNLTHRRATDLRDRIRNKFPDGYKHAESAPLAAEVRKAQKLEKQVFEKKPDTQAANTASNGSDRKDREKEQAGVTLPSLTLDDDEMDWDPNPRLPPMLPWDEEI